MNPKPACTDEYLNSLAQTGFLFFFFLLVPFISFAGQNDSLRVNESSYIKSFRSNPHFTFELARRRQVLNLRNADLDTLSFVYEPNTRTNLIFSFDYKWLSISFGLLSLPTADSRLKGNSNQFSLRSNFNGKRILSSVFLQYYEGFYLSNPQAIDPTWNVLTDSFPQRSDVSTSTLFGNIYYLFKPDNFSFRAALWQLDRQERSAGSFLAGASIRFFGFSSDSMRTLVPEQAQALFGSDRLVVAQRVSNVSFNFGYVHTFVYKKAWFFTLYFVPGLSIQNSLYQAENSQIIREPGQVVGMSEFRMILGYNGDKWFGGLSSYSISFASNNRSKVWIENNYNWFRIFAGFRLNAPGPERKAKLLQKIGL